MNSDSIRIKFEDVEASQAGLFAQQLGEEIQDNAPEARVSRERTDPNAQDAGSMLVVFLEVGRIIAEHAGGITPVALELGGHFLKDAAVATAAHAVVGAIYEWWERRGRPTIAVELPDGKELRLSQSSTDPKKVLAELEPALTNPSSPS